MRLVLHILPFLGAVLVSDQGIDAVRVVDQTLSDDMNSEDPKEQAAVSCMQALRPVVHKISYRSLFFPLVNGKYWLVNQQNGGAMTMESSRKSDTQLGNALITNKPTRKDYWELQQLPTHATDAHMPFYALKKVGIQAYLVAVDGNAEASFQAQPPKNGLWRMTLNPDGNHWTLQHNLTMKYLQIEGGSSDEDNIVLGDTASNVSSWRLALPKRSRLGGRSRRKQVKKQWDVVSKVPLVPGFASRMTWADACPDAKSCSSSFEAERNRFRAFAKIAESKRNMVTENKVLGFCDWTIPSMKEFVSNFNIVHELQKHVQGCPDVLLSEYSLAFAKAIEMECFSSCVGELTSRMMTQASACDTAAQTNWTKMFASSVADNPQCATLPPDSLELMADHILQQKCWNWSIPDLLWVPNDELPKDTREFDGIAACSVPYYESRSQDASAVVQNGTCPEGSTCRCPETWAKHYDTVRDIQNRDISKRRDTHFVTVGSAAVPSLITQYKAGRLAASADSALRGVLAGAAASLALGPLSASAAGIGFLVTSASTIAMGLHADRVAWSCADSVGCWPEMPKRQKTTVSRRGCRLPEETKSGGSPLWFLPPPTLELRRTTFGCKLVACSEEDLKAQKIGFGRSKNNRISAWRPNVYNCQPLTYAAMTDEEQDNFVQQLLVSGVDREYELPAAAVAS